MACCALMAQYGVPWRIATRLAPGMGKLDAGNGASAIRSNMPEPEFKGNAFSGSKETKLNPEAEAAAFRENK